MKKIILAVVVVLFVFGSFVYGGKYDEAKPLLDEMIKATTAFIAAMEKAGDAKGVSAALDDNTAAMQKIGPKVKKLLAKYPELKDEKTHPEALKTRLKKMDDLTKKMIGALMKIGQYKDDSAVKDSLKRWEETMKLLDDAGENEEDEEEDGK